MVKVGHSLNPEKRLNTYQTGDPGRRYRLRRTVYFLDRIKAERQMHRLLQPWWAGGEWFECPVEDAIGLLDSIR